MARTLCGQVPAVSENGVSRVSLPTHVYVLAGVFGALMLGLLGVQLLMIDDQRTTTDQQLAIQARQSARAIPLIDETREALPELQRLGERAQELAREAGPLAEELQPAIEDLADADIDRNLRAAGTLAATLLD